MLDFISLYLFFNFSSSLLSLTQHTARNIPLVLHHVDTRCCWGVPQQAWRWCTCTESWVWRSGGFSPQSWKYHRSPGGWLWPLESAAYLPCLLALSDEVPGHPSCPPPSLPHPWVMDQQYIELVDPYCVNNSCLTQKWEKEGEQCFIKNNDA